MLEMSSLDIPLYSNGQSHRRRSKLPGRAVSAAILVVATGLGYLAFADNTSKDACATSASAVGQLMSVLGNKDSASKRVACQGEPRR